MNESCRQPFLFHLHNYDALVLKSTTNINTQEINYKPHHNLTNFPSKYTREDKNRILWAPKPQITTTHKIQLITSTKTRIQIM